jgi:hypothetical protein
MIKRTSTVDNDDLKFLIGKVEELHDCGYSEKTGILDNSRDFDTITLTNGKSSVFLYKGEYIVKVFSERALREGSVDNGFLEKLQDLDFPPQLYFYTDDVAVMEYVRERDILDVLSTVMAIDGREKAEILLDSILDQFDGAMRSMLDRNMLYSDMKIDTHFKWDVDSSRFRIIDFGSCIFLKDRKSAAETDELVSGRKAFLRSRILEDLR